MGIWKQMEQEMTSQTAKEMGLCIFLNKPKFNDGKQSSFK